MRPRRRTTIAVALAAAVTLGGCAAAPPGSPASPSPSMASTAPASPAAETTASTPHSPAGTWAAPGTVSTDLAAPWSIVFHDTAALVSERDSGRILEVLPDGSAREVGVVAGVVHGGEGGLLGLAVHDRLLYAYSTGEDGNRVLRYALDGEPGSLTLGDAEVVVSGLPAARTHNGGRIAFGPDDMLYVTVGDAGDRPAAQDVERLNGKILRLEPDGGVPADNPFPGSPVYSLGHRNPQGIAWADDGTMYASEFGQDAWDELNVIEPGGNYGWPEVEGVGGGDSFVNPIRVWTTDVASPSGLAFAAGSLYLANLRGERVRVIDPRAEANDREEWVGTVGRIRDVALAPDGALWILTNNTDGRGEPRDGDDRILVVR